MRVTLVAACFALVGCSELIGADDLEYTRGADGGVTAPSGPCAGNKGPVSVNIDGLFCIDSTEVTNDQYREFLESGAAVEQGPECAWNVLADGGAGGAGSGQADFVPPFLWPPGELAGDRPVVWVDWCDAKAYCEWAGKHMCGAVDGGPADFDADVASTRSEYFYACTRNGERAFPYGDTFDPEACVTVDRSRSYDVGSFPRCQGGFDGVFDLSGNVGEWLNLCSDFLGPPGHCRQSPAGWSSQTFPSSEYRCDRATFSDPTAEGAGTGIRCCSDAL